jgi:hypothetical protein
VTRLHRAVASLPPPLPATTNHFACRQHLAYRLEEKTGAIDDIQG